MYLKSNDKVAAVETMEKIYASNPTDENKVRLVYLYENANMQDKIATLYSKTYELGKNPEDLKKLLYLKKDPQLQYELLQQFYPYTGLTDEERFNFSITLIKFHQKAHQHNKIQAIIGDLEKIKSLSYSQREYISEFSHAYQQLPKQEIREKEQKSVKNSYSKPSNKSVITSYSIHYTKLYDMVLAYIIYDYFTIWLSITFVGEGVKLLLSTLLSYAMT